MNHLESLCVRYVGQNSSVMEGSDVELTELQDMLDESWIKLRTLIINLSETGTFCKMGKKSKILKLTAAGWKKFNSLMNIKYVGHPDQLDPIPVREPAVTSTPNINAELNMKRLHIKIADVIKPVADWKVGDFKLAESMELVGDCAMSGSQDNYYGRWQDKFVNWESFPRK